MPDEVGVPVIEKVKVPDPTEKFPDEIVAVNPNTPLDTNAWDTKGPPFPPE